MSSEFQKTAAGDVMVHSYGSEDVYVVLGRMENERYDTVCLSEDDVLERCRFVKSWIAR